MPADTTKDNLPRRLGGYDVLVPVATGAASTLLLGRQGDRPVAIKRMAPEFARHQNVDLFLADVHKAATIEHANIVPIRELVNRDGELLVVMDYLEGESAASLLRELKLRGETLGYGLGAYVASETGVAIDAAHDAGLLHEHITPDDVFIGYDGKVTLLNLGIASGVHRISETTTIGARELPYACPERCQGGPLDRQSDVFSLGAVLWELSTGVSPFGRSSEQETIRAISAGDLAVPPANILRSLPTELAEIAMRAVSSDRTQRYATVRAFRHELRTFLRGLPAGEASPEALAALMRRLFNDRIETTADILRRIASSPPAASSPPPPPEPAVEVEARAVSNRADRSSENLVATADSEPAEVPLRPAGVPRRPLIPVVIGIGLVLAMIAAVVVMRRPAGSIARAPGAHQGASSTLPNVPPPPAEVPSGAASDKMTLTIETRPPKATIAIGGTVMGESPVELKLPKGREALDVEIRHAGYQTLREEIVPDVDQKLRLTLVPSPSHAAPTAPSAPYHRFE
jgi:serine/threonine protein kinase